MPGRLLRSRAWLPRADCCCCSRREDHREALHHRQDLEGNDHTVSLLPEEFKAMVQQIREVETAIGSAAPREVSTGELMNA